MDYGYTYEIDNRGVGPSDFLEPGQWGAVTIFMHNTAALATATEFRRLSIQAPLDDAPLNQYITSNADMLWSHPNHVGSTISAFIGASNRRLYPQYLAGIEAWYTAFYIQLLTMSEANAVAVAFVNNNMPEWKAGELQRMIDAIGPEPSDWQVFQAISTFFTFGLITKI